MLELKHLSKTFKEKPVLNNLSFFAHSGNITVLVGKSGVGKSTFLRCLTGLEQTDEGEILIHQQKPRPGQIGLVFQNFNLFPHLSVLENLIFPQLHVLNIPRDKARLEALNLLTFVGLQEKADAYPQELSGGEQQRVAIARACAMKPDVLCYDEPTSALDPQTIEKIIDLMHQLKEQGLCQLIVTHDIPFAKRIADQIMALEDGKLKIK